MKIGKSYSLGDITKTKWWISIERKPWQWQRWFIGFEPTYCGTTHGIIIGTPLFVVLGHRRDLAWRHEETIRLDAVLARLNGPK